MKKDFVKELKKLDEDLKAAREHNVLKKQNLVYIKTQLSKIEAETQETIDEIAKYKVHNEEIDALISQSYEELKKVRT